VSFNINQSDVVRADFSEQLPCPWRGINVDAAPALFVEPSGTEVRSAASAFSMLIYLSLPEMGKPLGAI
jgi:hypothetical protein